MVNDSTYLTKNPKTSSKGRKVVPKLRNASTRTVHKHSTDVIAKKLWLTLLGDFRRCEGPAFARSAERAFHGGIAAFRDYQFPEVGLISPLRFKMWKQLADLLKRYRFKDDRYTKDEIAARTLDKHFEEQLTFSSYTRERSITTHIVLQCARRHARRILGRYNPDATIDLARFGKKSSIGCPLASAYIDVKLSNVAAFSGSSDCSKWFYDEILTKDEILKSLVDKLGVSRESATLLHDSLSLVLVDKSWKIDRPITPLTLLGLFYTYGVGEQVTTCLKDEGLNLATLQGRHARLVGMNSTRSDGDTTKGGTLTTADLSSASQSLTCDLLNAVLPRDWYNAIRKSFSHQLLIEAGGGRTIESYTASVLPMGNGLTFPVETLVFYVILKAIAELTGCKGTVSVYGDDLIYPSKMHRFVAGIFPKLNFKLNLDKTFSQAPFRESCGTDYYRGFEVRSAYVPDSSMELFNTRYSSFLYKCYNALRRRWDPELIPDTLNLLISELNGCCSNGIYRVPPSFPDTAGVKVKLGEIPMSRLDVRWSPISAIFAHGTRFYKFSYLSETTKNRVVCSVMPYYWLALQGLNDEITDLNFWETDYSFMREAPRQVLTWTTLKRERSYRSSSGEKVKRIVEKQLAMSTSRERCPMATVVVNDDTSKDGISQSDWF